jgi:hypothetical protein
MPVNKILAVIIVLLLLFSFLGWLILSGLSLLSGDPVVMAAAVLPGVVFFGFWGLVIKRLYSCPELPSSGVEKKD